MSGNANRAAFGLENEAAHPLLASQLLACYRQLYEIEDRDRAMTADERLVLRQLESRPVWNRMRELLHGEEAAKVLPKEKISDALRYLAVLIFVAMLCSCSFSIR